MGNVPTTPHGEGDLVERRLPDDVMLDIFERIRKNGVDDIRSCMGVCKQWRRLGMPMVYAVTWTSGANPLQAAIQVAKFENVKAIVMDRCSAPVNNWPQFLESLGCNWANPQRRWAPVFEALGRSCPGLTSLSMLRVGPRLTGDDVASLFSNCLSLRSVRLSKSLTYHAMSLPLDPRASLHSLSIESPRPLNHKEMSEQFRTPTLEPLQTLTTLSLQNIDPSRLPALSTLTRLRDLRINCYYAVISKLPSLHNLTLLETIDLNGCWSLRHLPPLNRFPRLRSLLLHGCRSLESVPGINRLTQLRALDLSSCRNLTIPPLTALRLLEEVGLDVLYEQRATWALPWLRQLTALRVLTLTVSGKLNVEVLRLPQGLRSLKIDRERDSLTRLLVEGPTSLQSLVTFQGVIPPLANTHGLADSSPLEGLRELEFNHVEHWAPFNIRPDDYMASFFLDDRAATFPDLEALGGGLQRLALGVPPELTQWPGRPFAHFSSLRELAIDGGGSRILEMPPLNGLCSLRTLEIRRFSDVRILPVLDGMPVLEEVRLSLLPSLVALPPLVEAPAGRLRKLHVIRCRALREIPPLDGLTRLEELCLGHCKLLTGLPDLSRLKQLQALSLNGCLNLERLPPLKGLASLQWLDLEGCFKIPFRDATARAKERRSNSEGLHGALEVVGPFDRAMQSRFFDSDPYDPNDLNARWMPWGERERPRPSFDVDLPASPTGVGQTTHAPTPSVDMSQMVARRNHRRRSVVPIA